jgi:hypothetical protein
VALSADENMAGGWNWVLKLGMCGALHPCIYMSSCEEALKHVYLYFYLYYCMISGGEYFVSWKWLGICDSCR